MLRHIIESWMTEVIQGGRHRAFADLHVDQVDAKFGPRDQWLRGAVDCAREAILIRNSRNWNFTIAIGMSLRSNPQRVGLPSVTYAQLEELLDDSPPSLYLFERGAEPWIDDADFGGATLDLPWISNLAVVPRFREWFDENDEDYRRSFWLCG